MWVNFGLERSHISVYSMPGASRSVLITHDRSSPNHLKEDCDMLRSKGLQYYSRFRNIETHVNNLHGEVVGNDLGETAWSR